MTTSLALDVGSSSVKAAVLVGMEPASPLVRVPFETRYDGVHAEVDPERIVRAVARAAREVLGQKVVKGIDVVAIATMAPSWLAMDKRGRPLTPVVTHQDRRAVEEARIIESVVGREVHLALTGNLPVPGGISSTTAFHFCRNERGVMRRAELVGHLSTYLLHALTGQRAMDPGNASFTGLYHTTGRMPTDGRSMWHESLVEMVGLKARQLPAVLTGDSVAGLLTAGGARLLSLPRGTPVLTGVMDTSAAILLGGAKPGMLFNVCGSTDVLATVTMNPVPDARYLTRHLGAGEAWLAVCTIPASGAALAWAKATLFGELSDGAFYKLAHKLARGRDRGGERAKGRGQGVVFAPQLAGSRLSVEQPTGAFTGLRLSTTREEMLVAVIDALARASAERLPVLRSVCRRLSREVLRTGGAQQLLGPILYRDWVGRFRFVDVPEATVIGLGKLASGNPV
jgi:xylulokinase